MAAGRTTGPLPVEGSVQGQGSRVSLWRTVSITWYRLPVMPVQAGRGHDQWGGLSVVMMETFVRRTAVRAPSGDRAAPWDNRAPIPQSLTGRLRRAWSALPWKFDHPADAIVSRFFRDSRGLGPRERTTPWSRRSIRCCARSCCLITLRPRAVVPRSAACDLGFHGPQDFLFSALTDREKAWLALVRQGGT